LQQQQHQQQQPQINVGFGGGVGVGVGGGGVFMPNNKFGNKKRKAESLFTCTICSIEVGSQDVLTSHMNGQKHAKRLRQINVTTSKMADGAAGNVATPLVNTLPAPNVKILTLPVSTAASNNNNNNGTNDTHAADGQNTAAPVKLYLQQLNDLANFHQVYIFIMHRIYTHFPFKLPWATIISPLGKPTGPIWATNKVA